MLVGLNLTLIGPSIYLLWAFLFLYSTIKSNQRLSRVIHFSGARFLAYLCILRSRQYHLVYILKSWHMYSTRSLLKMNSLNLGKKKLFLPFISTITVRCKNLDAWCFKVFLLYFRCFSIENDIDITTGIYFSVGLFKWLQISRLPLLNYWVMVNRIF